MGVDLERPAEADGDHLGLDNRGLQVVDFGTVAGTRGAAAGHAQPRDADSGTAADAAGLAAEIEVYAGDHGWTVLDSPVYDFDEGDRAWSRLLALYEAAL